MLTAVSRFSYKDHLTGIDHEAEFGGQPRSRSRQSRPPPGTDDDEEVRAERVR